MEDKNMEKLAQEFAKELYKIFGVIPDYDFENENRVLECTRKWTNYARAIGYDEGRAQTAHRMKVKQLKDGLVVRIFDSVTLASKSIGRDKSTLVKALKGNISHCGGFQWEYC